MGKGYVSAERNLEENSPIGTIPIDAIFSPLRKVNFTVTNARVGQQTDYDKLTLEVWTNGAVTPQDAVALAAKMNQAMGMNLVSTALQLIEAYIARMKAAPSISRSSPGVPVSSERLKACWIETDRLDSWRGVQKPSWMSTRLYGTARTGKSFFAGAEGRQTVPIQARPRSAASGHRIPRDPDFFSATVNPLSP